MSLAFGRSWRICVVNGSKPYSPDVLLRAVGKAITED